MIDDLWRKNAVGYCPSVGAWMDANGDGIGDFEGPTRQLDCIGGLGVTTIWPTPFQTTPHKDNGCNAADCYSVDPQYRTLGGFVEFKHAAKQRGMRVMIDRVVNPTSDQHPWFQEARQDPNPKRRQGDAIVLGEANVLPRANPQHFGDEGGRLHTMFNFQVNQNLFHALASGDSRPLAKLLQATRQAAGDIAVGFVPAPSRSNGATPIRCRTGRSA